MAAEPIYYIYLFEASDLEGFTRYPWMNRASVPPEL